MQVTYRSANSQFGFGKGLDVLYTSSTRIQKVTNRSERWWIQRNIKHLYDRYKMTNQVNCTIMVHKGNKQTSKVPNRIYIQFTLSQHQGPRTLTQCSRMGTALKRGEYCKDNLMGNGRRPLKLKKMTIRWHDRRWWTGMMYITTSSSSQVSNQAWVQER